MHLETIRMVPKTIPDPPRDHRRCFDEPSRILSSLDLVALLSSASPSWWCSWSRPSNEPLVVSFI